MASKQQLSTVAKLRRNSGRRFASDCAGYFYAVVAGCFGAVIAFAVANGAFNFLKTFFAAVLA